MLGTLAWCAGWYDFLNKIPGTLPIGGTGDRLIEAAASLGMLLCATGLDLHWPRGRAGWGCGCRVTGARSDRGARRLGGGPSKPLPPGWDRIDPKTGTPPGIGKGWDHAPGDTVSDLVRALVPKLPTMPAETGSAWAGAWVPAAYRALDEEFRSFVERALLSEPRGDLRIIGTLRPNWVAAAKSQGAVPVTAELAVRDRDVWHTFRSSKRSPVDLDWYKDLPSHLRNPNAVLLDLTREDPAFVLVFETGDNTVKLVVRVNYSVKNVGVLNIVRTGATMGPGDLAALIGSGLQLIEGNL